MVEYTGEAGGSARFEESGGPGDLGEEPYSCPHLAQPAATLPTCGRRAIVADVVEPTAWSCFAAVMQASFRMGLPEGPATSVFIAN